MSTATITAAPVAVVTFEDVLAAARKEFVEAPQPMAARASGQWD